MNLQSPCFDCLLAHLDLLIQKENLAVAVREEILSRLDQAMRNHQNSTVPPTSLMREFYHILEDYTGGRDLFQEEKILSTEFALKLLPEVRKILAADPSWETLLKIVISGNIIDYGADSHFTMDRALKVITDSVNRPVDRKQAADLLKAVEKAKSIFYIADNCGEAVFDRLLLEKLDGKAVLGVRGRPVLNDITPREIEISGLGEFPYIDTGDNTPGVSLQHSSEKFLEKLYNSDLIIAKGQGNYESLSELKRPIVFLLCVKCQVIGGYSGHPCGTLLIDNHHLEL